MLASIALTFSQPSVVTVNVSLVLVGIFGVFIIVGAVVSTSEAVESLRWPLPETFPRERELALSH